MKKCGAVLIAVAVFSLTGGTATATHPRPRGATPITVSLVPSFYPCNAPNRTHAPPLSFPSCAPPVRASSWLTVGTPDSTGPAAHMIGRMRFDTIAGAPGPPEDSDIFTALSVTDLRCTSTSMPTSVCNGFNSSDGPDYSGELQGLATVRITDHYSGPSLTETATVVAIPFPVTAQCANSADTGVGGTCSIATTFNTIVPGAIKDTQRSSWEFGQVQVLDGGQDGKISTGDNTLFATQGVFVP
jgi:hypothetical protein